MITRVSEALVRPGKRSEFMTKLHALVRGFPDRYSGLIDHEVLVDRDDADRVLYISRWTDEEALVEFAGTAWATAAVTFPGETALLCGPLTLRHFVSESGTAG